MAWKDKQNAVEELTRKMNENIKNLVLLQSFR